jgi:hypothetical protein
VPNVIGNSEEEVTA